MELTDARLEFIRGNFAPSRDFTELLKQYDDAHESRDAFVKANMDCHSLRGTENGPEQITAQVITDARAKKHEKDKADIAAGKPLGDHSKLIRDAQAKVEKYQQSLRIYGELIADARRAIEGLGRLSCLDGRRRLFLPRMRRRRDTSGLRLNCGPQTWSWGRQ